MVDAATTGKLKKQLSATGKNMFFASESVGEGHPDKLCDQISDGIVDACFKINPKAKVAMETAVKTGMIVLLGETGVTKEEVNFEQVARNVAKEIGFDHEKMGLNGTTCDVITNIEAQSAEIGQAVHGQETTPDDDLGAGDQGLMFGYATDEWDQELLHPASHVFSNKICEEMAIARKNGSIPWLRPDCKSQVILEYRQETDGRVTPLRAYNVLISTQHDEEVTNETIKEVLIEKIIKKVIPAEMLTDCEFVINPSGKFCIGGPHADAGLTGRKIIVDTYGGWAPHGGGAFSGKDPTKVDRSGAYYARYVAKSLVAAGLCHRALVQVSYAIGIMDPLSVFVETYGTNKEGVSQDDIHRIVHNNFNFRPGNVIKELDLRRPIYQKTAAFGHFGRMDPDFKWEYPKKNLKLD